MVLEKTLESPLDCKEISPECSLETEDEMVGWYHRLDVLEFEQASGVDDE